jgi:AAA domain-containing protein
MLRLSRADDVEAVEAARGDQEGVGRVSFSFRPAKRENVPLLLGIAGGTGSGKTYSALRIAKGLAGDQPFAVIDTEAGRANHYADLFQFQHGDLTPPFTPEHYIEAITAAEQAGFGVIVVDSFSHEYAGDGGLLDWHETELQRMAGDDWKKREAMTFAAWVKPKKEHKRLVSKLLQLRSHLVVCLRAEEKIEIVKNARTGKTEVVPKKTLAGHVGWIPIAEKSFAYELTLSLVLTPDAPGIPRPIKLQEQHKPFVPLDKPLDENVGAALAKWAAGGKASSNGKSKPQADDVSGLRDTLIELVNELGATDSVELVEKKAKAGDREWLEKQIATARETIAQRNRIGQDDESEGEQGSFFAEAAAAAQARRQETGE